jgi:hypothetical protein
MQLCQGRCALRMCMMLVVGAHQNFRFRTCESTGLPVLVPVCSVGFTIRVIHVHGYSRILRDIGHWTTIVPHTPYITGGLPQ